MSRDEIAVCLLVGSLALWAALHLVLATRLMARRPWWRGLAALLVPPLAPYWGMRAGLRLHAGAWIATLGVWIVARAFFAR